MNIQLGDIVLLKKGHPCGTNEWKVIRVGADFKIKCQGCGHIVMLPRTTFEKSVKKILVHSEENKIEE